MQNRNALRHVVHLLRSRVMEPSFERTFTAYEMRSSNWDGVTERYAYLSMPYCVLHLTSIQILISGSTTYAIALMLTGFRYTHAEPIIDAMKGVKNEVRVIPIPPSPSSLVSHLAHSLPSILAHSRIILAYARSADDRTAGRDPGPQARIHSRRRVLRTVLRMAGRGHRQRRPSASSSPSLPTRTHR